MDILTKNGQNYKNKTCSQTVYTILKYQNPIVPKIRTSAVRRAQEACPMPATETPRERVSRLRSEMLERPKPGKAKAGKFPRLAGGVLMAIRAVCISSTESPFPCRTPRSYRR